MSERGRGARMLVLAGVVVMAIGIFDGRELQAMSAAEACRLWRTDPRQDDVFVYYKLTATSVVTGEQWVYEGYDRRPSPALDAERPVACSIARPPESVGPYRLSTK